MATKRQSYTTSEKLKIIQFAEEHGNRAAQREFGIAESNVRLWRKSKENLQKMPRLQRDGVHTPMFLNSLDIFAESILVLLRLLR